MKKRYFPQLLLILFFSFARIALDAALTQSTVFSNHMVLQRDQPIAVFGRADSGATITVTFKSQSKQTLVGGDGQWLLHLDPEPADASGRVMTVSDGTATLTYTGVLVGEVWVVSGQSNVAYSMNTALPADLTEAQSTVNAYPNVRLFTSAAKASDTWQLHTSGTISSFSNTAYFFARKLHEEIGTEVPVGVITAAVGGTGIERWYSAEQQALDPDLNASNAGGTRGDLYASRLGPIIPYSVRGAVWWQGEQDASDIEGWEYRRHLSSLVKNWREDWGQDTLHFGIIGLHNYNLRNGNVPTAEADLNPGTAMNLWRNQPEIVEAQIFAQRSLENSFFAVGIDVGKPTDAPDFIHPQNRRIVAERLARTAADKVYDLGARPASPRYSHHNIVGDTVTVVFDQVGGGLTTSDSHTPNNVAIAGADRVWYYADTVSIVNNRLVASANEVAEPVALRYAWDNQPDANLVTAEGMPVEPFRTDAWPFNSWPNHHAWSPPADRYECSLLQPSHQQIYASGRRILLSANASSDVSEIHYTEFYANGIKVAEAVGNPMIVPWYNVPSGTYNIVAKAFDEDGVEKDSQTVPMTVSATGPTITTYTLTVNGGYGGGQFAAGDTVRIRAQAPPAGDPFIGWTGDVSSVSDTDYAFTVVTMPAANVTLTANFGDAAGNTIPVVTLTSPLAGTYEPGTNITFAATATDAEDGDLSASIVWSSDRDGVLGTGTSFSSNQLSLGTHVITASVTDSQAKTGTATVTISIAEISDVPVATLSTPANNATYNTGEAISFTGSVHDTEDGDLTASAIWSSSIDGVIGTGGSVVRSNLSAGTHTITLSASDSGGQAGMAVITVNVLSSVFLELDFTGTDPAATSPWTATIGKAGNMSYSGLTLGANYASEPSGSGDRAPSLTNKYGFKGSYGRTRTTLDDALLNGHYVSFTLTPDSGYSLDVNGARLSLTLERSGDSASGYNAPTNVALLGSVGGFTSGAVLDDMTFASSLNQYTPQSVTLDFPVSGMDRVTSATEFRIYFYNGQYNTFCQMSINALKIEGASVVSDTPSPSYDTWVSSISWSGADSALTADPDQDGVLNLLEYAMNLNPLEPQLDHLLTVSTESDGGQNYVSLTYRRNKNATDLTFTVQTSADLITWDDYVPSPADTSITPIDASTDRVTVRKAIDSENQMMLRLEVEK